MALISSSVLLSTLSLYHLTIAYALVAAPASLLKQGLIFTVGSAMQLPQLSATVHLPSDIAHPASFANPLTLPGNPALGLASVFLAFLALSDTTALLMREEVYNAFWTAQAPSRLAALFALEAWIYFAKPAIGQAVQGWSKALLNDLVFTWAFVEIVITFWVLMALRDEKKVLMQKRAYGMGKKQDQQD